MSIGTNQTNNPKYNKSSEDYGLHSSFETHLQALVFTGAQKSFSDS